MARSPCRRKGEGRGRRALFFLPAEDGIRHVAVTGVQTCALPISAGPAPAPLETCPAPSSRYPVEPASCPAPRARAPAPPIRAALLQGRAGLLVQNGRSSSS